MRTVDEESVVMLGVEGAEIKSLKRHFLPTSKPTKEYLHINIDEINISIDHRWDGCTVGGNCHGG